MMRTSLSEHGRTSVLPMLQGFRVREYPTVLHRRQFSVSKIRVARTIREHLKLIGLLVSLRITGRASDRPAPPRG
jgi:hypothetical protein